MDGMAVEGVEVVELTVEGVAVEMVTVVGMSLRGTLWQSKPLTLCPRSKRERERLGSYSPI
jgi:hypothetical protein